MVIIRAFLIDFVRILMIYLGIRLILEYFFPNGTFDAFQLLKGQIPQASLLAGLLSALRLLAKPKARN